MAVHVDSVDKVIDTYFALVTTRSFSYKGKSHQPRQLKVSPSLFDVYQCPAYCGGCCFKFSLDYLPDEPRPYRLKARGIEFDGRIITVLSDLQRDNDGKMCRNLRQSDGRCEIHGEHPFSCDFEVIKFFTSNSPARLPRLTQQAYPRGWSYQRTDGGTGALCQVWGKSSPTARSVSEVVRRLKRLKDWTDHFGLQTRLPGIISWARQGPHTKPAIF